MYSVKLDINEKIYDKIMFFLENLPKNDLKIVEIKSAKQETKESNLVDFFRKSPLVGEIDFSRDDEKYNGRLRF